MTHFEVHNKEAGSDKQLNTISKEKFLHLLYGIYVSTNDVLHYDDWCKHNNYDLQSISSLVDDLTDEGLIEPRSVGRNVELSWLGVRHVEQHQLFEPDVIDAERRLRNSVIRQVGEQRVKEGPRYLIDYHQLAAELPVNPAAFERAFGYLQFFGFIEPVGGSFCKLTRFGEEQYHAFRQAIEVAEKFQSLEDSKNAQSRGHELESLFARIAEAEGWEAHTNVLACGEENDVILLRPGRFDAFVISCKWEKNPAKTDYLYSLRARLALRPGSHGILVSMAGFAKPLVANAGETGQGIVLLFGKTDIETIITSQSTITSMIESKWSALIMHRRILWN